MSGWGDSNFIIGSRMERPSSTKAAIEQKKEQREELLTAVEMFIQQGGSIKAIPYGVSKDQQLNQMREGKLELISQKQLSERWQVRCGNIPIIMTNFSSIMSIMQAGERYWWIEDIKRIEETKSKLIKGYYSEK